MTDVQCIGVLSDSHGRFDAVAEAVEALKAHGAEALLHCGDIGAGAAGRRVLDELAAADVPVVFVWGNTDYDADTLAAYAKALGLTCLDLGGKVEIAGRSVGLAHGDRTDVLDGLAGSDYLLTGHSHVPHDHREGSTRLLNPGALYRTAKKTAALLWPAEDRWQLVDIQS